MKEYVVVDRERVTLLMNDTKKISDVIHRDIMTVIEVFTSDFGVGSWGAYRGIVVSDTWSFQDAIKYIVAEGCPLQKYEALTAIGDKPLGWNLENCRYDNGLFN